MGSTIVFGKYFITSPFKVVLGFKDIEENLLKMLSKKVLLDALVRFHSNVKCGILNIT